MLELVEVIPTQRRSLRRAVDVRCDLICDLWDEPIEHRVRDLSEDGLFVETPYPLHEGSEVILELQPPSEDRPIYALGAVRRSMLCRRQGERGRTGMGIELVDLDRRNRQRLRSSLRGLPPPLPIQRSKQTDLVWVETVLTFEEELDEQLNIWELTETLGIEDFDVAFEHLRALGDLLTTPVRPRQELRLVG